MCEINGVVKSSYSLPQNGGDNPCGPDSRKKWGDVTIFPGLSDQKIPSELDGITCSFLA